MKTKKVTKKNPVPKKAVNRASKDVESVKDDFLSAMEIPDWASGGFNEDIYNGIQDDLKKKTDVSKSATWNRVKQAHIRKFLGNLALTGSSVAAARVTGIPYIYWRRLKRNDPEFRSQWDEAKSGSMAILKNAIRSAMYERGIVGIEKPIYQGGKLVGYERVYSDSILAQMGKTYLPEMKEQKAVDGAIAVAMQFSNQLAMLISGLLNKDVIDISSNSNHLQALPAPSK